MHFATASEHRDYFLRHRHIEFEGLITEEEAKQFLEKAAPVIDKKVKVLRLEPKTTSSLFLAGRDLWKEDPFLKKIVLRPQLAEIASSLFNKKPLRLAYDQLLQKGSTDDFPIHNAHSLQQISCFQSVVCGLMLRLSGESEATKTFNFFCPLPQKVGSGVLFNPDLPFSFEPLFQNKDDRFLLIVYCLEKTVYTLEKNDPNTHALKRDGYVFGDLLKNDTHPIVYR